VNAQYSVGPATSPSGGGPVSQLQPDASDLSGAPNALEVSFQGLLEQRMNPSGPDAASPAVAQELAYSQQAIDAKAIPVDALAAFFAAQTLNAQRPDTAGGMAHANGLPLDLARDLAVEWRTFADADQGRAGSQAADSAAADDRLMAAMSADAGKRLPQMTADASGAIRALVSESALARSSTGDASLLAGSDAPELLPGGVATTANAPAAPGGPDARVANVSVPTPLGRAGWADAMSERVTWLIGQRMQSADIHLNPPQLGPVEVRISIQNDQASLFFSSSHALVREAIQAALPRLGEMLAQSGLTLGQTSVGAESFAGQQHASRDSGGNGRGSEHPGDADPRIASGVGEVAGSAVQIRVNGRPGIDTFV